MRRSSIGLLVVVTLLFTVSWSAERAILASRARSAPAAPTGSAADQARRDGLDLDAVTEAMRHRIVAGPTGVLATEDARYRAEFDAGGFRVGPAADGADGAGMRLSTTAIERGTTPAELAPGAWRADGNVATRSMAPAVTERVTALDGAVEWDVVLDSEPAGRGDLRVTARASGVTGAPTREADGIRWALDGAGQGTVVMGELVVKDATGAELHRSLPETDGSTVSLTVPAAVLDRATYPLTVDPSVGPERPVSEVAPSNAAKAQTAPAAAFDGTNYLVVWQDHRSGDYDDIFGARVSRTGDVLDPAGIPIDTRGFSEATPTVAFDGTNYLVAWSGYTDATTSFDLYGARVTPAGAVLDAPAIRISSRTTNELVPAVSFDGTNYLVVSEDSPSDFMEPGDGDVYGTRVTPAGAVLDPAGIPIATSDDARGPAVAFDGVDHVVVWSAYGFNDIRVARVNPSGVVLDPTGITVHRGGVSPAVAFDGTNLLVVWSGRGPGGTLDIAGARVSPAGAVLDPEAITISAAADAQTLPAVGFDGANLLVAWMDERSGEADIYGARVTPAGEVLGATDFPISTAPRVQEVPTVATGGTDSLVAWSDQRAGSGIALGPPADIFGARVPDAGAVLEPEGIALSRSANGQTRPAVAFDGANYFVVWIDHRHGDPAVYGGRVSPGGTVLDGAGIRIASTAAELDEEPAVVFDGSNFLAVWRDVRTDERGDIYAARVSRAGALLDPAGIAVSTGESDQRWPALAFDGTNSLVTWTDWRSAGQDIYGTRISRAGTVLNPSGVRIGTGPGATNQFLPAVAFNGTDYLVTWTSDEAIYGDIYGTRVSRAGAVLDPSGIHVSSADGYQAFATATSDGSNFFVAWFDGRDGADDYDIYATRVGADGTVLDPAGIPVSTAPGRQWFPAVAYNRRYLVTWQDERNGQSDVYAARVDTTGAVRDPDGFAIATSGEVEGRPAVSAGPGDRFGVVNERFALDRPYGADRAMLRQVAPK